MTCTTTREHCENCGSTEYLTRGGYSGCCNELQVAKGDCRAFHVEADAHRANLVYCPTCWWEFDADIESAITAHRAQCDSEVAAPSI